MRLGESGLGDMGLGDLCIFTAVGRELHQQTGKKVLPYRPVFRLYQKIILNIKGKKNRWVNRDIYQANPHFYQGEKDKSSVMPVAVPDKFYGDNIPHPTDPNRRVYTKPYSHCLVQVCKYYGIENPKIKCDLFFTEAEQKKIDDFTAKLPPHFITIEPHSQTHAMPNRGYPFSKWQKVVNALKDKIAVVQLGAPGTEILENVIDLTGKTGFKVAAGIAGKSQLFMSIDNGLTHAVTGTDTIGLIVLTGWQPKKHIGYPQNININIAKHGPCGLSIPCKDCATDAENHDPAEIILTALQYLGLK